MSRSTRGRRERNFARRTRPGDPPGMLVPDPHAPPPVLEVIGFGNGMCEQRRLTSAAEIAPLRKQHPLVWVNVDGLGDTRMIAEIGQLFGLHNLALEDVVHVHQRAKAEHYDGHYFVVARAPRPSEGVTFEQMSLFVGADFLVSFQEAPGGDCLEPVRQRIRSGALRGASSPGHLMYAILDAIIDHYFPMLEVLGERLDAIEEEILARPDRTVIPKIQATKRDLRQIRKAIWPLRDAINTLMRDETPLVSHHTRIHLRDCHDHTVQLIDLLESYREIASGLTDFHLSSVSAQTNEVMRVLTIISTIFIPLTFVVGIYGMNFDRSSPWNMPELGWRWGYCIVLSGMALIAGSMVLSFHRRGWLFSRPRAQNSED